MSESFLRGRHAGESRRREFSDRVDGEILRRATADRKKVAARLGVSRSLIDKQLEDEKRSALSTLRIWLETNLEDLPAREALAPLAHLNARFAGLLDQRAATGSAVDLLRAGAGAMESCGAMLEEIAEDVRDHRLSDAERVRLEERVREHQRRIGQLLAEIAAANEQDHNDRGKPARLRGVKG